MSKTVFPIRNRFLPGVPAAVTTASAKDAAALVASGAFTDDPQHPERDHSAVDLSVDAAPVEVVPEPVVEITEAPAEIEASPE